MNSDIDIAVFILCFGIPFLIKLRLEFDIALRETDYLSLENLNSIHDASLELILEQNLHPSRTHNVTSPNLQLPDLFKLL